MMYATMKRLHGDKMFDAAVQKSILVSCDMAHAVHPNYSSRFEYFGLDPLSLFS